jgi:DNA-binding PadR family transcriptional regulator
MAAREVTPNFVKIRRRCDETVHELMSSTEAIVLLAYPFATMRAISNSRGLSRTLRDNGDARSIRFTHGSLYMVVQQLAKAGFVAEHETSREGQRPERTIYALTDAGRRELRDWLRELIEEPRHEYPSFVAALSLIAALPPGEAVPLLHRRLDRLAARRAEIQALVDDALAQGVPGLFLVEEEYRKAMLAAESSFVAELVDRITDPVTGWGSMWAQFHGDEFPPPAPSQRP